MSKIFLGIDPGIADTGYGLIKTEDNGSLVCLEYGSIKTDKKVGMSQRLVELFEALEKLLKKYQPDRVAVEQLFFNKNVKTALIVGQARGIVLLVLQRHKIPLLELTPGQIKQAVACSGRADKKQVQKMMKTILNLKEIPQPDDAADALAMAWCAAVYKKICLPN